MTKELIAKAREQAILAGWPKSELYNQIADELERLTAEIADYEQEILRIHNDKVDHFEARIAAEREVSKLTAELARKDAVLCEIAWKSSRAGVGDAGT